MSFHPLDWATHFRCIAATVTSVVLLAAPVVAQDLRSPADRPVLTVDGAISVTNVEGKAAFDMEMLQSLLEVTFRTSTVWTEGVHEFSGVPLKAVLAHLGATGATSVSARAINDYSVEIPVGSITDTAPIIAYHMDGARFSRREKGPLWVVYPFDSDEAYRSEVIYGRSIWQLDRLTVKK